MKKIINTFFTIMICLVSFNLQAQVSPINKEMADRLESERKESKQDYKSNQNSETFIYHELIIYNYDGKLVLEEKKINKEKLNEDRSLLPKFLFLEKLNSSLGKRNLNLITELGNQGIKIVSHSFIPFENGEKHIYILEL